MNARKLIGIRIGILCCAALLSGCGLIYTNIRVPYAYNAATPVDVHADKDDLLVTGQACTSTAAFLIAWGNAGYAAATQKALEAYPKATLYDVKTDVKLNSYVLGLYTHTCTIVTGKVAKSS